MNWKRLSPFAIPTAVRLIVVVVSGLVLTYLLLVSDPTRIFRWLPFHVSRETYDNTPDWAQHFLAYLTFSFILRWYTAAKSRWVVPCAVGFAIAHAMITEYLQRFVPERTSDLRDLFVNLLGITTGTLLGRAAMWLYNAQQSEIEPSLLLRPQRVLPTSNAQATPICGLSRDAVAAGPERIKAPRVLNFAFLSGTCAVTAVLLGVIYVVHGLQVQRHAGTLMELGRKAEVGGDLNAAKNYFGRYVGLVPNDVNALADYGQLLDQAELGKRQAFMVYEDVLRADPTREEIRRRQIDIALDSGRHPDALAHVRYLRQSYPKEGKLDYQAGRCFEGLGDYAEAVKSYEAAIEKSPDLLEPYGRLAWLCQTRLDRSERAKKLVDTLVERFPKSSVVWLTRGKFRAEFGSLEDAQADIAEAMKLDPDGAETLLVAARLSYQRASAARASGRNALAQRIVANARQQSQHGVELHPDNVELRLLQVQLEAHFGSMETAQREIDKLATDSPRDLRTRILLADMALEQGRFDDAKKAIEQLPRTPGSDALRLFLQGRILMSQKEWPEAVTALEQARRISTQFSGLIERSDLGLAQCHAALNNADAEMAAFRRVLKTNPVSVPARLGLATCLLRQQKIKEAIAEYRPLVHLPQVRLQLVRLLIVQNLQLPELARDWGEVERLLDQSKQEQEDPVTETLLRAELLAARGQTDAARRVIEDARTTQTDRVEFWLALSRLAQKSGDVRQANLWMGQALSIAGDTTQAETLLQETMEKNPTDFNTALALLQHFVRHQKHDQAKTLFQQLEERRKLHERPLELAQCYVTLGEDVAAQAVLRRVLEAAPNDFSALRALAELHLRQHQLEAAGPLLSKLLEAEATLPASDVHWTRRQLSVVLASQGDSTERQNALKLLERNEKDSVRSSEDTRARAFILAASTRRADHETAVKLLGELADHNQLIVKDRWLLARLLDKLGQTEEADSRYRQVLSDLPQRVDYRAEFISSLTRRGHLDEAGQQLAELRRIDSRSFSTIAAETQWLVARGEAVTAFKRIDAEIAQAKDADRVAQFAILADSLSRADAAATATFAPLAEKLFRQCAAQQPRYLVDLVRSMSKAEKPDEAMTVCLDEWTRFPGDTAARLALSLLAPSEGRAERMQRLETGLLKAIEQQPRSLTLQTNLADLRCWQERYSDAEELYRRVLGVDRNYAVAANNLAWLLAMRQRDLDDALSLIEKFIDRLGPKPQLLDTRGCIYLALRRATPALRDFTTVSEDVQSASTWLHLAVAQFELGDVTAARKSWRRAKQSGLQAASLHPLERSWLTKLEAGLEKAAPIEAAQK